MSAPTKRVEIIPAKRRALILEHLRINGAASIGELAEKAAFIREHYEDSIDEQIFDVILTDLRRFAAEGPLTWA